MTINMGTAAYMAPEISSLSVWARDFSRDTKEINIAMDGRTDSIEKHKLLAQNHAKTLNGLDLSCSSSLSSISGEWESEWVSERVCMSERVNG